MKSINLTKIFILFLSITLFSCSNEDDNYKSFNGPQEAILFNSPNSVLEVLPTEEGPTFIEVLVSSTTTSNVDRVIPVSVSPFTSATPNQYSVESTSAVILAGENTATIKIISGDYNSLPLSGGVDLVLVFDDPGYVLPNRTNHVVSIQRGCLDTKVDLSITFDGYASEITWFITNSSNQIVASGGGYSDGLSSFSQRLCLESGNYTFIMNDSYGDGLSFPSNGSFSLKLVSSGATLVEGGGNFGSTTGPRLFTIN